MNIFRLILLFSLVCPLSVPLRAQDNVDFNRDVRPLLAAKCLACHGPDDETREADLRLDEPESATESFAIVPGKPSESELLRRVRSTDPDEHMPPAESGAPLTDEQTLLLERWIADGAQYEEHWAFVPPTKPEIPGDGDLAPIDAFVRARLKEHGLQPSPEADRYTLIRRVSLDLIGLPPTPEEAEAFVHDQSEDAYEKLVDRLLASSRYGERWARPWLDLARYSDTNGYEKDRPRSIWPYRDWVIRALNEDMPYDQFTIEQIAGDMLPDATLEQRIATGFHRNTMLNEEGGIDPQEYRFYAMVDRVATTGLVWLGLTTGCCQCHSHKYDPLSHTDFYSLMALLNNTEEPDLLLTEEDPAQREKRERLTQQILELRGTLVNEFPPLPDQPDTPENREQHARMKFEEWIAQQRPFAARWEPLEPATMSTNSVKLTHEGSGIIFSIGDVTKRDVFDVTYSIAADQLPVTALRLEALADDRLPAGGPGRAFYEGRKGDFFLSEFSAQLGEQQLSFSGASHSGGKISVGSGNANAENVYDGDGSTGWSTSGMEGQDNYLILNLASPIEEPGELHVTLLFERHFAASLGKFRIAATSTEGTPKATVHRDIQALLTRDPGTWNEIERTFVFSEFLDKAPELAEARKKIEQLSKQIPEVPHTMVMEERPADFPRETYRHHRGEYLSPREQVKPHVPGIFEPIPEGQPKNRLSFARWLVSDRNPLAARVAVNRAWRAFFGRGLVDTSGDFGTQSDPPSHPQLLDWLAVDFVENGWSLKQLHKQIVMSETYRQSSAVTPETLQNDPDNVWLSRGPRHRLEAELVRDSLLQSSGLLSTKMYGPGVYPPQPAEVTGLAYGATAWNTSTGEDRYRRSIYTFQKRTAPFAAYLVFDAPTGENCTARRDRSNTPLQALTLLNDEMFLEMARGAVATLFEQSLDTDEARVRYLFQMFLTRPPTPVEQAELLTFQRHQFERFASGELNPPEIGGPEASAEVAAWTMVARVLMNLDETVTK